MTHNNLGKKLGAATTIGILLAVGLAVAGVATAETEALPPHAVEYVEIVYDNAPAMSEKDIEALINELGGIPAACNATGGSTGCAVSCFWSCCAIVCEPGTTPECECSWGRARCKCVEALILAAE